MGKCDNYTISRHCQVQHSHRNGIDPDGYRARAKDCTKIRIRHVDSWKGRQKIKSNAICTGGELPRAIVRSILLEDVNSAAQKAIPFR